MELNLQEELNQFGISSRQLLPLDKASSRLTRYLDLTPESAARKRQTGIPLPAAIVEYEGRPLVYVIKNDSLAQSPKSMREEIAHVIRTLACRGEGDYLAVVYLGELVVYPLGLTTKGPKCFAISGRDERAPMLLSDLASGAAMGDLQLQKQARANGEALHQLLFKLLTKVSSALRSSGALSASRDNDQVLPLVGRALFARFLIDRGIINTITFPELYDAAQPEECFASPMIAARTCAWLDDKFNGELLPLFDKPHPSQDDYLEFFQDIHSCSDRVLHELSNILYRAPDGKLLLHLDWDGIDFAHVPIGLLSEVYEDYAHRFYKDDALRESVRFTPKHFAEYTVDQAFGGIAQGQRHLAKVLDPAAGAGIFLVLSLQRIFAERWAATGRRPDTQEIRKILRDQIRGFDINGSALTLAALSLYLTALELDADPYPPEKLRFERLLGSVLFNMRQENERFPFDDHVLGSLGPLADGAEHRNAYDLVIGNPPWTAWEGKNSNQMNAYATSMVRRILKCRLGDIESSSIAETYEHNDNIPDVAFIWRAMEWAKKGGVISLIVHGRILFKRTEKGANMRDSLLKSLHVTGILNGSELTALWPSLNQPFCIVFARNELPNPSSRFRFVTPTLDTGSGGRYRMRLDHESAQPIDWATIKRRPFLMKTLYRGGVLDVQLIDRLLEKTIPEQIYVDEDTSYDDASPSIPVQFEPPVAVKIGDIWNEADGLAAGQGFMPGPGQKANELLALRGKQLTLKDSPGLRIECTPLKLKAFNTPQLHRKRKPEIYQPPLVLISQGFGESKDSIRSRLYVENTPLIYNFNFYGFSTAGYSEPVALAKYLFVLTNSELFSYFILQTSSKYGVERRAILVEDIETFPIIPIEMLSDKQRGEMLKIADSLNLDDNNSWFNLNQWVCDLYELSEADSQVIEDTLATRMPYEKSRNHAIKEASTTELANFKKSIEAVLCPLFELSGDKLRVEFIKLPSSTWVAFDILVGEQMVARPFDSMLPLAMALGDEEGASRIFFQTGENRLRVAIRNQYRYLTRTRGRLCALDVLREYGHLFPVSMQ